MIPTADPLFMSRHPSHFVERRVISLRNRIRNLRQPPDRIRHVVISVRQIRRRIRAPHRFEQNNTNLSYELAKRDEGRQTYNILCVLVPRRVAEKALMYSPNRN